MSDRYPDPPEIVEDHPSLSGINASLRDTVWPHFRDDARRYKRGRKLSRIQHKGRTKALGVLVFLLVIPGLIATVGIFGWLGSHAGGGGALIGALVGLVAFAVGLFALGGGFLRYVDEGPNAPERKVVRLTAKGLGFEHRGTDLGETPALRDGFGTMKALKVLPEIEEHVEDCFTHAGTGGSVELADITLYTGDTADNVMTHYFRGLVIALPNLVTARGQTVGVGPRRGQARLAKHLWALDGSDLPARFQPLVLESDAFNDAFTLHTDDQVGARRALTPAFMERVLALQDILDARAVDFLFEAECTTLAFDLRRDAFDYGTGDRLLEPEELRKVIEEFVGILRVRDVLTGAAATGGPATKA